MIFCILKSGRLSIEQQDFIIKAANRSTAQGKEDERMELEATLLACGFSEADAKMVVGAFLSGLTKVARSSGFSDGQKLGDALTEDQATGCSRRRLMTG